MDLKKGYIDPLQSARRRIRRGTARLHLPAGSGLLQNLPLMHFHPHTELFLQLRGRRQFFCPHESFELGPGDLCLMPPLLPHRELAFNAPEAAFDGIVLWAVKEGFSIHHSVLLRNGGKPSVGHNMTPSTSLAPTIRHLLEDCINMPSPDIRLPMLDSLLGLLASALQSHGDSPPPAPADAAAQIVHAARGIIQAYLPDATLTISRIAAEVGCTPDHLSRCFQKQLGQSAQSHLLEQRLTLACKLLKTQQMRICEVGWACGFNSANYFIRTFREHIGQTPKAYRNLWLPQPPLA